MEIIISAVAHEIKAFHVKHLIGVDTVCVGCYYMGVEILGGGYPSSLAPLSNSERVVKVGEKINGYAVDSIKEYRDKMIADAVQKALGAELAGMPETAEFWDVIAEEYRLKTNEEVTFRMIMRGVRRDG